MVVCAESGRTKENKNAIDREKGKLQSDLLIKHRLQRYAACDGHLIDGCQCVQPAENIYELVERDLKLLAAMGWQALFTPA
jgi:hypothetical protein